MDIERVDLAADAYLAEAEGPAKARLLFLKGLWALQAEIAGTAPAGYAPPALDDARDALATRQPLFLASPPEVPANAYREAVSRVARYVIDAEILIDDEAAALDGADFGAAFGDEAVSVAARDFGAFADSVREALGEGAPSEATTAFVLHTALVPFLTGASAACIAALGRFDWDIWGSGDCPVCGAAAALGRMGESTEAQGASRTLWCAQCHAAWSYDRLRCARCGSHDTSKLRYTYEEGDPAHRAHLCDECGGYLKVTFEGEMRKPTSMQVEEAVSLPLDVIARDKGYSPAGAAEQTGT